MTMLSRISIAAVASACLVAAAAPACAQGTAQPQQASPTASTGNGETTLQQQMDAMRRELDRVRQDNQAMRGEIDQLHAENDNQWLTQQRADQIKALVQDVLADADTRASLLDTGMTAGWNEHFFLASADGRFLLTLEGLEQIRWVMNHHDSVPFASPGLDNDAWRSGIENTRTQLTFSGHVFSDNIEYLVRGEFLRNGGSEFLLDAWVRYLFSDKFSVRFGQFKLPFNREELVGDGLGLAVERSLLNETISPRRSQGIELEYLDAVNRWDLSFEDGSSASLGGLTGAATVGTVWSAQDTEWAVTSRYERLLAGTWDQFADMTSPPGDEFGLLFGIGAHAQNGERNNNFTFGRDETRMFEATADISAEWGGASAFGSFLYAYVDTPNVIARFYGLVVQGGVYVAPKWEVFARGEYGWIDAHDVHLEDLQVITMGVNYYIDGHDLKWTTDVSFSFKKLEGLYASDLAGFRADSPGANPQIVIRTQFQLMF